jgi:hypothetical protein
MNLKKLMYFAVVGRLHAAVLKVEYPVATCILQVYRDMFTYPRLFNIGH